MVQWLDFTFQHGGAAYIPGHGSKVPHASWPKTKTQNRSKIVTDSTKTLKTGLRHTHKYMYIYIYTYMCVYIYIYTV